MGRCKLFQLKMSCSKEKIIESPKDFIYLGIFKYFDISNLIADTAAREMMRLFLTENELNWGSLSNMPFITRRYGIGLRLEQCEAFIVKFIIQNAGRYFDDPTLYDSEALGIIMEIKQPIYPATVDMLSSRVVHRLFSDLYLKIDSLSKIRGFEAQCEMYEYQIGERQQKAIKTNDYHRIRGEMLKRIDCEQLQTLLNNQTLEAIDKLVDENLDKLSVLDEKLDDLCHDVTRGFDGCNAALTGIRNELHSTQINFNRELKTTEQKLLKAISEGFALNLK